jgi:hypothetical protein
LKLRAGLLLLLFVHVLLHPWVHAIGMAKGSSTPAKIIRSVPSSEGGALSGDQCELCRVGHNAAVTPQLPQSDLLNPRWIRTALQAVNYSSLQADRRLPSRAPPIL